MLNLLDEVETKSGNVGGVIYKFDGAKIFFIDENGTKFTAQESDLVQTGWMTYSERVDVLESYGLMPQGLR